MFLIQIRKPVSHWSYFREKGGGPLWGWGRSRRTQGRGMDSLQKETTGRTPGGICSPSPGCTSFCASSSSFPLWALSISVLLSTQWTVPTQNKVPEYCTVIVISRHPSSLSGWSSALALKSWERDLTGLTHVRSPLGSGHPQPAGSPQVAPADSLPAPVCLPPALGGLHQSSSLTLASAWVWSVGSPSRTMEERRGWGWDSLPAGSAGVGYVPTRKPQLHSRRPSQQDA